MLLLHSALPHHTVASLVAAFHRGDVEALESVDVEERIQRIESELDGLGWTWMGGWVVSRDEKGDFTSWS